MTLTLPHWLVFLCQVVGAVSLIFTMAVFAVAACIMANAESARRRRERTIARDTEARRERAADSMRFIHRYGEGFRAYGIELRPGSRTKRTLAALAADPLHRSRPAHPDELMPNIIDVNE